MREPPRAIDWLVPTFAAALGAHALASCVTRVTIELMRGVTPFASRVRALDEAILPYWLGVAFTLPVVGVLWYLAPVVRYFRAGCPRPAPELVQRRVVSAPALLAVVSFTPWLLATLFFPAVTIAVFGTWSTDLMSQQVLSALVNGFLATATTYLLADLIFRRRVVPWVFPDGRLTAVAGTFVLGVRGRLLVFLMAVGFVPLFVALGLVRAAAVRLEAGLPVERVMPAMTEASEITFGVFLALGTFLTLVLARTFTRPLGDVVNVLRRVQEGDLAAAAAVTSSDEVGVLEDGVNAMVAGLRDRERILQAFGRVVEPAVRDRLLSGTLQEGGEERTATVLFCDLQGFTALAERTPPAELVRTLNEFFAAMTPWVRECGGFVDKFIGDALLGVFGLLDADTADAVADGAAAAVRCALGLRARLAELNARRAAAGRSALALKVGVRGWVQPRQAEHRIVLLRRG
jgi:adenylate cyclase